MLGESAVPALIGLVKSEARTGLFGLKGKELVGSSGPLNSQFVRINSPALLKIVRTPIQPKRIAHISP
jgi:hypothetical protein